MDNPSTSRNATVLRERTLSVARQVADYLGGQENLNTILRHAAATHQVAVVVAWQLGIKSDDPALTELGMPVLREYGGKHGLSGRGVGEPQISIEAVARVLSVAAGIESTTVHR